MSTQPSQLSALLLAALLAPAATGQALADDATVFPMPQTKLYVEECGGCHTAYAPGLLPARSWKKMLGELGRHFGEDASVDARTLEQLGAALEALAADSGAANPLMRRIAAAIPPGDAPQRISQTGFFKYMHDEVPAYIWKRPKIGSQANCGACHTKANEGRYLEREISIPK